MCAAAYFVNHTLGIDESSKYMKTHFRTVFPSLTHIYIQIKFCMYSHTASGSHTNTVLAHAYLRTITFKAVFFHDAGLALATTC